MRRACGEVQNRERLRVRDSYTVLGCVRQPLAKLADGPMCFLIVRIDFAENHCGKIGEEYAD